MLETREKLEAALRLNLEESKDIEGFSRAFFPNHIVSKIPQFHREIYSLAMDSHFRKVVIAAPRGFSKSTIISFIYVVWQALYKKSKFIVIISDTYTQAKFLLDTIKSELEHNILLRQIYGDMVSDKWSEGEIELKNGVKIICKGTGMKVRGIKHREVRPDLIVLDDLENTELVESRDRRDKLLKWFMAEVLPALHRDGKIIYIGTIIHYDSLLNKVLKDRTWKGKLYRAIEHGKSLWPERFSLDELAKIKREYLNQGLVSSFHSEYMNDPISDENAEFKKEWFKYFVLSELNIKELNIFTTVDLAISKKEASDYTVIMTCGFDRKNNMYLLEMIRKRLNPFEVLDQLFMTYQKWKPMKVGIETVGYQKALIFFAKDEMRKRNLFLPMMELKSDQDKQRRIRGLIPRYNISSVYHQNIHTDLEEELLRFPKGEHDDCIDALAYQLQLAFPYKVKTANEPSYRNYPYIDDSFKKSIRDTEDKSWLEI